MMRALGTPVQRAGTRCVERGAGIERQARVSAVQQSAPVRRRRRQAVDELGGPAPAARMPALCVTASDRAPL